MVAVLAHVTAFFVAVALSGLLMFPALPLLPLISRFHALYPPLMGVLGLAAGAASFLIATLVLSWFGIPPGKVIVIMLALGWGQNNLRRALRATGDLQSTGEWSLLIGLLTGLGTAVAIYWRT